MKVGGRMQRSGLRNRVHFIGKSATDILEEVDDTATTIARLEKSVAVLPFDSLNLDDQTTVFSDGMSAEILHRLSTLRLLNVIAAPSSFALRNSKENFVFTLVALVEVLFTPFFSNL